jgi:hypothetical protein
MRYAHPACHAKAQQIKRDRNELNWEQGLSNRPGSGGARAGNALDPVSPSAKRGPQKGLW